MTAPPERHISQPLARIMSMPGRGCASAPPILRLLGVGIALGDQAIMSQNLKDGMLIRPSPFFYPSPARYHVVCERDRLHMLIHRNFIKWMFDTMETEIER